MFASIMIEAVEGGVGLDVSPAAHWGHRGARSHPGQSVWIQELLLLGSRADKPDAGGVVEAQG